MSFLEKMGYRATGAEERATELLHSHLNHGQRYTLRQHGWFTVRGSDGKHYRIQRRRSDNVSVLDSKGDVIQRLWVEVHVDYGGRLVPVEDVMLAQKLRIETDAIAYRNLSC